MSNGWNRIAVAIALAVLLAGCNGAASGGGGGGGGDAAALSESGDVPEATAQEAQAREASAGDAGDGGDGGDGGSAGDAAALRPQAIIRTGQVRLEVSDFGRARRNLTRQVRAYGGFVSDSREEHHTVDNETFTTGRVVLRVPQDNFTAMMTDVEAEGSVQESSTNQQDVTDQLVDIEARLTNLRAQRDRLRTLYDRANDTEDVLAVQERLSEVQTEIERLEARKQSLEQRVAYSTIRVELYEPRPEPDREPPSQWYDTPVVDAFLQSVDGVLVALRALVVAFAYALPYLIVFVGPVVLLVGGVVAYHRGLFDRFR